MSEDRIWLSPPHMGGEEFEFVRQAFQTNWIAPAGPQITAFEEALVSYNDAGYCAAVSSGTAAIQLALIVMGVKAGDEVLCSTFTFAGSCNPITYLGAHPIFVDSEKTTWNMDPDLLETAIKDRVRLTSKKPACILLVHLYGMPAQMDRIMAIAQRYGIPILEDAAEALGSTYKGKKLGTLGTVGVYSFNGNKIITTSGGGALVSKDQKMIERARYLATQARDPAPHYQHSEIGYNFRLSNICAAIGLGQMRVLDERVARRRAIFEAYMLALSDLTPLTFIGEIGESKSNRWLTTATVEGADDQSIMSDLRVFLDKKEIESRPLWKPMHLQPVFQDCPAYVNGTSEGLFNAGICLPSGSGLTTDQQARIVIAIKDFWVTKV